jgi:serine/threonine-protein kinase
VDVATARATLRGAGFKVTVVKADTDDPAEDGFVIAQFPTGGTKAAPGSTVTITVGEYVPPPTDTDTTPTDTVPVP